MWSPVLVLGGCLCILLLPPEHLERGTLTSLLSSVRQSHVFHPSRWSQVVTIPDSNVKMLSNISAKTGKLSQWPSKIRASRTQSHKRWGYSDVQLGEIVYRETGSSPRSLELSEKMCAKINTAKSFPWWRKSPASFGFQTLSLQMVTSVKAVPAWIRAGVRTASGNTPALVWKDTKAETVNYVSSSSWQAFKSELPGELNVGARGEGRVKMSKGTISCHVWCRVCAPLWRATAVTENNRNEWPYNPLIAGVQWHTQSPLGSSERGRGTFMKHMAHWRRSENWLPSWSRMHPSSWLLRFLVVLGNDSKSPPLTFISANASINCSGLSNHKNLNHVINPTWKSH